MITNGLNGSHCIVSVPSYGVIATVTLNPIQPIC